MEHTLKGLFGEQSVTKVVGLYGTQNDAEAAAAQARALQGMLPTQVRLLGPQDAKVSHREFFGRTLEPEQRGIFRTLFKAHAITGGVGAVIGLLLYAWLYSTGQPMVASSPVVAFIVFLNFGTVFGLIVGGLIAHYEAEQHPLPETTGVQALKFLLEQHGLKQSDLPEIGSQGVVSEILTGKRELNIRQVRALGERFGVSPASFV